MKRSVIALLRVTALAVPLAFGVTVMEPIAGPGLRAQTPTCTLKATAVGGEIHCHEEGTNCKVACPAEQ